MYQKVDRTELLSRDLASWKAAYGGFSVHLGSYESLKTLEQIFTPRCQQRISFISFILVFFRYHVPATNSVAPFFAYKPTHNPQFLHSLWRRANARNFSVKTPYDGQFTLINSADKTKITWLPQPTEHHSFFLKCTLATMMTALTPWPFQYYASFDDRYKLVAEGEQFRWLLPESKVNRKLATAHEWRGSNGLEFWVHSTLNKRVPL